MASPLDMPKQKLVAPPEIQTDLRPENHAKTTVRPGLVSEVRVHDGIVKAKHLKPGMKVRSWLHNKACGSEKTVDTVERVGDGSTIKVTFSSGHPEGEYKAAYRFHSQELEGTSILVKTRGFVPAD